MAFLGWLGRTFGPIVLEHSLPLLRDWWKARQAPSGGKGDQFQQLAGDVEQLKSHVTQVAADLDLLNSNLETLNRGFSAREERLRKWVLVVVVWNTVITLAVVLLMVAVIRR